MSSEVKQDPQKEPINELHLFGMTHYDYYSTHLSELILNRNIFYTLIDYTKDTLENIRHSSTLANTIIIQIAAIYRQLQDDFANFPKAYETILSNINHDRDLGEAKSLDDFSKMLREAAGKYKHDVIAFTADRLDIRENIDVKETLLELLKTIVKAHAYLIISIEKPCKRKFIIIHYKAYEEQDFIIIDPRMEHAGILNMDDIIQYIIRTRKLNSYLDGDPNEPSWIRSDYEANLLLTMK